MRLPVIFILKIFRNCFSLKSEAGWVDSRKFFPNSKHWKLQLFLSRLYFEILFLFHQTFLNFLSLHFWLSLRFAKPEIFLIKINTIISGLVSKFSVCSPRTNFAFMHYLPISTVLKRNVKVIFFLVLIILHYFYYIIESPWVK